MKRSSFLSVVAITCFILTISCIEKPKNNISNNNLIPTYTPLVLTYDRFGVAEAIQNNDESDASVRFNFLFNGSRNQFWSIEKRKKGYIIRSYLNRKVLSINPKDSSVIQQTFNGNKNQFWIISGKKDSLIIMSKTLKKYLTVGLNEYLILGNYSPTKSTMVISIISKDSGRTGFLQLLRKL
jgi:hypothetical protein